VDLATRFDDLTAGAQDSDRDGLLRRAVARHLLDFRTWHSLAIGQGLDDHEVLEVSARLFLA